MILLTDEALESIFELSHRDNGRKEIFREIAKAQAKKIVGELKDRNWLSFNSHKDKIRVMWERDWQALLDEVE